MFGGATHFSVCAGSKQILDWQLDYLNNNEFFAKDDLNCEFGIAFDCSSQVEGAGITTKGVFYICHYDAAPLLVHVGVFRLVILLQWQ